MLEIKEKILQYFKMSEEDKELILLDIIEMYRNILLDKPGIGLLQAIDYDIDYFMREEHFEIVQALTDIKQIILKIEEELNNV